MTIITDSDLHDSLCQICIESPHSLLSELGYAAKQKIIETTVCISYKKGDLIYQEGDMPTGLHCLLTGKAKIYKEGIGGRQQIVRMASRSVLSVTELSSPKKYTLLRLKLLKILSFAGLKPN